MADVTRFYLAARWEDQATARDLANALVAAGLPHLACTARWLEVTASQNTGLAAISCLNDVYRGHVLVQWNPKAVHRSGTGGRHVEVGVALALGRPVIVLGEPEHVFHHHPLVFPFPTSSAPEDVAAAIQDLAEAAAHRALAPPTLPWEVIR